MIAQGLGFLTFRCRKKAIMNFRYIIICSLVFVVLLPFTVQGKTTLPHEFDGMVPVYPGAKAVKSIYTRGDVIVVFTSADSYGTVVEYYSKRLLKQGWRSHTDAAVKLDPGQMQYSKDNIFLTLSREAETGDMVSGFIIRLRYPDGRE